VVLCEEQVGGQPPIPTVTLVIIPPSVEIFLTGILDDSRLLDCRPERLVPTLSQPSSESTIGSVECTVGLDRPIEVVFGDLSIVTMTVLDILNQLPESGGGVLDGLSEVRSVVMERLICVSFNNHTII